MPNHINSASRLHGLVRTAIGTGDNQTRSADIWARSFGIDLGPQARSGGAVSDLLDALRLTQCEVEAVFTGMSAKGFSGSLYKPALQTVAHALTPLELSNSWGGHRVALQQGQVLNAIGFCAEILPDEEGEISATDLESVLALVVELEALLEVSLLPAHVKGLIVHQLNLIHQALRRYRVQGAIALREAAWTAAGEMAHAEATGGSAVDLRSTDEVQKLDSLWKRVNGLADGAIKIDTLVQIGERVMKAIGGGS